MNRIVKTTLAIVLFAGLPLAGTVAAPESQEEVARRLLDRTDDLARGQSSHGRMTMHVKTERWERSLTMEVWTQGEERSLVRILSPASEAGVATLKVEDDIWNYLPKVDRTMKVPPSLMGGSWMGSHFTNDDLVKESRMADDYTFRIASTPDQEPVGTWVIESTPKPDAPVVWGKVMVAVRAADEMPLEVKYFDEQGELARTMTFSDVKAMGGRTFPTRMTLTVADKPGEFTEVSYDEMAFDVALPPETFTLQALKR